MACKWEMQEGSRVSLASDCVVLGTTSSCLSTMEALRQGLVCSSGALMSSRARFTSWLGHCLSEQTWATTPYPKPLKESYAPLRVHIFVHELEQCLTSSGHTIVFFVWVNYMYQDCKQGITKSFVFLSMAEFPRALFILIAHPSMGTLPGPRSF